MSWKAEEIPHQKLEAGQLSPWCEEYIQVSNGQVCKGPFAPEAKIQLEGSTEDEAKAKMKQKLSELTPEGFAIYSRGFGLEPYDKPVEGAYIYISWFVGVIVKGAYWRKTEAALLEDVERRIVEQLQSFKMDIIDGPSMEKMRQVAQETIQKLYADGTLKHEKLRVECKLDEADPRTVRIRVYKLEEKA